MMMHLQNAVSTHPSGPRRPQDSETKTKRMVVLHGFLMEGAGGRQKKSIPTSSRATPAPAPPRRATPPAGGERLIRQSVLAFADNVRIRR
ncbi:hypothetical protein EVAR_18418_1 [Eumeta japonica]|uniref:Uncharacterized protein n=1 Tax=Eumeta variegata TaxID=151549 RepID=A0A4C1UU20_EUMVA|nr:hypothetical protein EVAR_18418_1 [Eumeta japonica]